MAYDHYQKGEVPVPGFSLEQYLGRGGFGEVWKASGPGGVPVAMKVKPTSAKLTAAIEAALQTAKPSQS